MKMKPNHLQENKNPMQGMYIMYELFKIAKEDIIIFMEDTSRMT